MAQPDSVVRSTLTLALTRVPSTAASASASAAASAAAAASASASAAAAASAAASASASGSPTQVLSCRMNLNKDVVLAKIWEYLGLVRAYTKPRGKPPDF